MQAADRVADAKQSREIQKSKSERVESTQKFLGKDWRWDTSFLEQQVCRNVVFLASDRFMPAGVALEPSPSLEERIRAGTGMASSNTQDAKNAKEQHHPDAMELSQSTKGRHENNAPAGKDPFKMESCLPIP